jgi:hypothetical protein
MSQQPMTLAERLEALEARVAHLENSQAGNPTSVSAPVDEGGVVAGKRGRKKADDKLDEAADEVAL